MNEYLFAPAPKNFLSTVKCMFHLKFQDLISNFMLEMMKIFENEILQVNHWISSVLVNLIVF